MHIRLVKRKEGNGTEKAGFVETVVFNVDSYILHSNDLSGDELVIYKGDSKNHYINLNADKFFVMNDNGNTIDKGIIKK